MEQGGAGAAVAMLLKANRHFWILFRRVEAPRTTSASLRRPQALADAATWRRWAARDWSALTQWAAMTTPACRRLQRNAVALFRPGRVARVIYSPGQAAARALIFTTLDSGTWRCSGRFDDSRAFNSRMAIPACHQNTPFTSLD